MSTKPKKRKSTIESIRLNNLTIDESIQQREALNDNVVAEYAELMSDGVQFDQITVFLDNDGIHWLADGFHRVTAAKRCGLIEFRAEIRGGSRRDAVLFACGVNARHGLRRSNADKRRAVKTMLADPECFQWSDREIARWCGVHHQLVGRVRTVLIGDRSVEESSIAQSSGASKLDRKTPETSSEEVAQKPSATVHQKSPNRPTINVAQTQEVNEAHGKRPRAAPRESTLPALQTTDPDALPSDDKKYVNLDRYFEACKELIKVLPVATHRREAFEVMQRSRDIVIRCFRNISVRDIRDCAEKIQKAADKAQESPSENEPANQKSRPAYAHDEQGA